jgi:hypothetical protein
MFNKETHMSCKNCQLKQKVTFKNKVIFCFGLIKKVYKPKDFYRFCIIKNNNKNCTEIMLEEVYAIISGLSRLLIDKRCRDLTKRKKNER